MKIDHYFLILSLAFFGVGNILRFARWNLICNAAHIYQRKLDFIAYFIGRSLNLVLPFKSGDLIRIAVVKKKEDALPTTILLGIERLIDLFFLLVLSIFFSFQIKIDVLTLVFVFVITSTVLIIFSFLRWKFSKSKVVSITLWSLKRVISRRVIIKTILMSLPIVMIFVAGNFFLLKWLKGATPLHSLIENQLTVTSAFRLPFSDKYNLLILVSCLVPIIFTTHLSKYFKLESGWTSRLKNNNEIEKLAFFEIRNANRFAKVLLFPGEKIEKVFQGGSNAITYLTFGRNGYRVRKSARGVGKETLRQQFNYLGSFEDEDRIPMVSIDQDTYDYFGYSMEYFEDHQTLNTYLKNTNSQEQIFGDLLKDYESCFFRGEDAQMGDIGSYAHEKFDRLRKHVKKSSHQDKSWATISSKLLNQIGVMEDYVLLNCHDTKVGNSHGDFSASNILYDGHTFRYIDLLPKSPHSSIESDMAKLYLSILIELEDRTLLQNTDSNFQEMTSFLSVGAIETAEVLLKLLSTKISEQVVFSHAVLHFARILPYRITNVDSAIYWEEVLAKTLVHIEV